jgi:AraC-like DNA-binding protein
LNDVIVRKFSGAAGVGKLAYQFMTTAFAEISNVNPEHEWEIVGAISQLIRLAMLEVAEVQTDLSVREQWRERIRAYIDEHLRDPNLSLDQIASVMNCSKRYVHKLFESEGISISEYIWQMRLSRCREELLDPVFANKSITEIAYSWGFSNSAHFSRAFKEKFHICPRTYRAMDHHEEDLAWLDVGPRLKEAERAEAKVSPMAALMRQLKIAGSGG